VVIETLIRVAVIVIIIIVVVAVGIISRDWTVEVLAIGNVQETTREPVPPMPEALCCPSAPGWFRRWSVAHYG